MLSIYYISTSVLGLVATTIIANKSIQRVNTPLGYPPVCTGYFIEGWPLQYGISIPTNRLPCFRLTWGRAITHNPALNRQHEWITPRKIVPRISSAASEKHKYSRYSSCTASHHRGLTRWYIYGMYMTMHNYISDVLCVLYTQFVWFYL
jgi:hypothetical protein